MLIERHRSDRAELIRSFIARRKLEYTTGPFPKLFDKSALHREPVSDFRPSAPTTPRIKIRDRSEKAFQRALFSQGQTEIVFGTGLQKLEWLDFELPVVPGKLPRRAACDLVARIDARETTLCEVKYSRTSESNTSSVLEYAVFELLYQLQLVALNAHNSKSVHHRGHQFKPFEWQDVAEARSAMILGNQHLWGRTDCGTRNRIQSLIRTAQDEIGIAIIPLSAADIVFDHPDEEYTPIWPEHVEKRLTVATPTEDAER